MGVGDKRELQEDNFYMHKIPSPNFASHDIILDMLESDEVVIFDHSLGVNDYPYFMPFFYQWSTMRETIRKKSGRR